MTNQGIHNAKVLLKEQMQTLNTCWCPRKLNLFDKIGFTTTPVVLGCFLSPVQKAVELVEFNTFCCDVGIHLTKVF